MRLSTAIQTHPRRADLAAALQARLPGSELAVDPDPDGYPSAWRTYSLALDTTPGWATHRLVIQDDAEPCANLLPALELVIAARPDDVIVLFVGGRPNEHARALRRACEADETFCVLQPSRWVPAVAIVWPAPVICPALCWVQAQGYPERFTADDEIIGRATTALGQRVLATVPSLVEHPDVVEPISGRKRAWAGLDPGRVAACFIGCDPLEIDWR